MVIQCQTIWKYPRTIYIAHQQNKHNKRSFSTEHKVKAFGDDLIIISADKALHHEVLTQMDLCTREMDLEIRAEKWYSLSLQGHKHNSNKPTTVIASFHI